MVRGALRGGGGRMSTGMKGSDGHKRNEPKINKKIRESRIGCDRCIRKNSFMKSHISTSEDLFCGKIK